MAVYGSSTERTDYSSDKAADPVAVTIVGNRTKSPRVAMRTESFICSATSPLQQILTANARRTGAIIQASANVAIAESKTAVQQAGAYTLVGGGALSLTTTEEVYAYDASNNATITVITEYELDG